MCAHWTPAPNYERERTSAKHFARLSSQTKALHSRIPPLDPLVDPVTIPIYHSSVYRNTSVNHFSNILMQKDGFKRYVYQRLGNPTSETAEVIINELEEGEGTLLFSSGLAAVTSVFLCFLKAGDHFIYQKPCYGGTGKFISATLEKYGVETSSFLSGSDPAEILKLIKPNTRMIFGESPSNPDVSILDLKELGKISKESQEILTVVDGTFASPHLQQPIRDGVSISVHSCTKYIGGHADIIAGCVTVDRLDLWRKLKQFQCTNGSYLSSFDASLMIRGLKTLPLRMDQQCRNAQKVAEFLESHPKVAHVYYPGLKSHPQHEVAKRNMKGFGGMVSFEMRSKEEAKKFVESLRLIILAISLGGAESLVEHPASMTHGEIVMNDEQRRESKISDGLVRLSVGIEGVEDLLADIDQGLNAVQDHMYRG